MWSIVALMTVFTLDNWYRTVRNMRRNVHSQCGCYSYNRFEGSVPIIILLSVIDLRAMYPTQKMLGRGRFLGDNIPG